jgi:hypothetical protein
LKVKRHVTWDITIGDNIIQRIGDSIDALASGEPSGLEAIQAYLYLFTVSSSFILSETLEEQFFVYSLGILSLRGLWTCGLTASNIKMGHVGLIIVYNVFILIASSQSFIEAHLLLKLYI